MPNTFLISDPHFGHNNMACNFRRFDGAPIRPFRDAAHQDQVICDNWRRIIRPCDKVYVLGDVALKRSALSLLADLPGDKILIKGNHDIYQLKDYAPYFRDIRASWVLDKCLLTHIPVHPDSEGRFRANIHGHTHDYCLPDPWYVNVCVEHTNYGPIAWEEVRAKVVDTPTPN